MLQDNVCGHPSDRPHFLLSGSTSLGVWLPMSQNVCILIRVGRWPRMPQSRGHTAVACHTALLCPRMSRGSEFPQSEGKIILTALLYLSSIPGKTRYLFLFFYYIFGKCLLIASIFFLRQNVCLFRIKL